MKCEAKPIRHPQKILETKMVSVIIPTYNRSSFLRKTLEQILRQTCPSYEVIVIDQTAEHPEEITRYLASIQNLIRYERLFPPSLTRARNLGLQRASGEVIVCIDDDVDIPCDFISRHLKNYDDPHICAVAGRIVDEKTRGRLEPSRCGAITWYGRVIPNFHATRRITVDHGRGANFSFRRERALRCGGFDEHIGGNGLRDDTDFSIRYLKAGSGRMVFDPEATLFHHVAPSGGCRVENQGVDPLTYANELYFLLKHFSRWLFPYFLLNLFVRFFLMRGGMRQFKAWRDIPRRLQAMTGGLRIGVGLYRAYRKERRNSRRSGR